MFIDSSRDSDLLTQPVLEIRQATEADRDAIWNIFHSVVAPGDTYAFDPRISREDALVYWFREDTHAYVAAQDRHVIGTYILRPNQPGSGSHVANAAFADILNLRTNLGEARPRIIEVETHEAGETGIVMRTIFKKLSVSRE